jgi:hypothetical protein
VLLADVERARVTLHEPPARDRRKARTSKQADAAIADAESCAFSLSCKGLSAALWSASAGTARRN